MDIEKLKYPIGKYAAPAEITESDVNNWINTIEAFPSRLKAMVSSLTDAQLEATYRSGGWTIRQIVHHVVDSHLNSYVRFKWTLTEDRPTIKTYQQSLWAELPDAKNAPVKVSLDFLSALHERWVYMLRSLSEEQWNRTFIHPEYNKEFNLKWLLGLYDWHCRHHYAHVELALKSLER